MELNALANQGLERRHIARVVLGLHIGMCVRCSALDYGFVLRGQTFVSLMVDVQRQLWAHFPPTGVIVVRRYFMETKLEVVIRPHPFSGINRAFLQRLVNLASGDVLRHHTQTFQNATGETTAPELQAFQVSDRADFLAEPTTHLHAGVSHREINDAHFGEMLAQEFEAIALVHPGRHLAAVQAKGYGAVQRISGVFAKEVVRGGVCHLDGAVGNTVQHAKGRHQLAGRMGAYREFAAAELTDFFGKHFADTKQGIERLGKARSNAPAQSALGMNCRCSPGSQDASDSSVFNN